jgi:hypothetical protein
MGKNSSDSNNSSESEEIDSDEKPVYKISSLLKPKKLSRKFDFKQPKINNSEQWASVFGSVLKKGKHKIKVKFDEIKWENNVYTGKINNKNM